MTYQHKQKERQNRETYSRRVSGGSCNRITVPMQNTKHMETVVKKFREIADDFENQLNDKSRPQFRKVSYAKYSLYALHRELIETADESYHNIRGLDFKGTR